jgi:hypothetical protein
MSDNKNNTKNTEQITKQLGQEVYYETVSCKQRQVVNYSIKQKRKTEVL